MSNFNRGRPTAKGGIYYPHGLPRPVSHNHEVLETLEVLEKQHPEHKKPNGDKNVSM